MNMCFSKQKADIGGFKQHLDQVLRTSANKIGYWWIK